MSVWRFSLGPILEYCKQYEGDRWILIKVQIGRELSVAVFEFLIDYLRGEQVSIRVSISKRWKAVEVEVYLVRLLFSFKVGF